ncbi:SRPBCC family protein [Phytohabitans sp. ZYX-F-186]|uniref:SRPBCC family protein n=1 Tax=Phytohabitans maris TaxID=3071409 RepID=A0ABU0ZWZ1_9ACTN|nr:SRPBCC family protein [Phytohabitans sp. ZYX-F-186]MDQ7911468.1 SRPBCC family protein [Phytohabitans sp. ZYX-F-186]
MKRRVTWALTAAGVGAALAATYPLLLRDRCLHWGATPDEVIRELPGDDLIPDPDVLATRAVAVDAPPAAIWPWLVQMGSGRGGAYTYDWIENLFGLDMHSADRILPEYQDLKVGDVLPIGADGPSMTVEILEPERVLCLRAGNLEWVWTFALYPTTDGGTRLISRNLIATPDAPALRRLYNTLFLEPGSLVMERKMLLGIKERAERTAGDRPPAVARATG